MLFNIKEKIILRHKNIHFILRCANACLKPSLCPTLFTANEQANCVQSQVDTIRQGLTSQCESGFLSQMHAAHGPVVHVIHGAEINLLKDYYHK